MNLIVRAATAEDQAAITKMVRAAGINPLHLDWSNFIVVEAVTLPDLGRQHLAGVGQLRPRGRDAHELASLAVAPEFQGAGIGQLLVQTLIRRGVFVRAKPLYLMCEGKLAGYYRRFGFVELTNPCAMPRGMAWLYRMARVLAPWGSRLTGEPQRLAVMVWPHTLSYIYPVTS